MPSDKHNLRMARAGDLISSLINVASSRDVPFHQPQQLKCLHHGATFVPLWSPILSSQLHKVTICGRHIMASVRDIKVDEALLVLRLAYNVETSFFLFLNKEYKHAIQQYRQSMKQLTNYNSTLLAIANSCLTKHCWNWDVMAFTYRADSCGARISRVYSLYFL